MELRVNGQAQRLPDDAVDPAMPLLWVLRDVLQLTGTKYGCGVAACGACTVHVDGQAARACVVPLAAVAGKSPGIAHRVRRSRAAGMWAGCLALRLARVPRATPSPGFRWKSAAKEA